MQPQKENVQCGVQRFSYPSLSNFLLDLVQKRIIGCSTFMCCKLFSLSFSDSLWNKKGYKQTSQPDWLSALPDSEAPLARSALHCQPACPFHHLTLASGHPVRLACPFRSQAYLWRSCSSVHQYLY